MTSLIEISIPVLNEESTLAENIAVVIEFMRSHRIEDTSVSIVIADNGSEDRTPIIAQELASTYPREVLYMKVDKRGVGRALKHTWSNSEADIVGYMDLDLATDLQHFGPAMDALLVQGADVVYGSRLHKESVVVGRTAKREIVSRAFNRIARTYLGSNIRDAMCGFKFLRRKWVNELMHKGAMSDGWFFCAEILLVAEAIGLDLVELPVRWTDSPDSRVNIRKLALEYLKAMRDLKPKLRAAR